MTGPEKSPTHPAQKIRRARLGAFFLFLGISACTSVPEEKPVHVCAPADQCPEVQADTPTAEGNLSDGKRLFSLHCVSCHGEDGKGAKPGVGDLTSGVWQSASRSAQIAATIKNGRGEGMPAFALSQQSIAHLVVFVRSLSGAQIKAKPYP